MSNNIFLIFIWYLIIPSSIIGYGIFFQKIIFEKLTDINIGYLGLFGIFFFITYSYLSNFLIPHSKIHNLVFIFLGFVFFLKNYFSKNFNKKQVSLFYLILLIFFISILIFKSHDDFEYYHFPYTYFLTQHDLTIGIGNFGHGFRTQSSIFYLNSLFYLPLIDFYLFNLGAILIMIFSNCILIDKIFSNYNFNKKISKDLFFKYLSLFTVIFINIFFYRISEHGTDKSSQILVFILFIEIIYFLNSKKLIKNNLFNVYLLLSLIVSFKIFYLLYLSLFLILWIYVLKFKKNILKSIKFFVNNKFFFIFSPLVLLIIFTNFFNTGCLIYPISFTCNENLTWSIPVEQVKQMNDWYELWAKAGANPNYRVSNPDYYIQGINWFNNWLESYFFTKVTDLVFGLIFLTSIIIILFKENKKKIFKIIHLKYVYLILLILLAEWFLNHPALRYGGYALISLFIFIPISLYLTNNSIDISRFNKKALILVCLCFFIFFMRNVNRISNENLKYNYNPFQNAFYELNQKHFRIENKFKNILDKNKDCKNSGDFELCLGDIHKQSKKFNKIIIENN